MVVVLIGSLFASRSLRGRLKSVLGVGVYGCGRGMLRGRRHGVRQKEPGTIILDRRAYGREKANVGENTLIGYRDLMASMNRLTTPNSLAQPL